MKKFVAVLLAVVMAFSLGITGFAGELRAEVTPGHMIVASHYEHIKAGGVYTIPVTILSDFEAEGVTEGEFYLGFTFGFSGNADVDVMDVQFSDELKAYNGFEGYECQYGEVDPGTGYVAFKVGDIGLLKKDNFEIAEVTLKVSENYEDGQYTLFSLSPYDLTWLTSDFGVDVAFEEFSTAAIVAPDGEQYTLSVGDNSNDLIYSDSVLADSFEWDPEPELPLKDKILLWLRQTTLKVLNGIISVLEILAGLVEGQINGN